METHIVEVEKFVVKGYGLRGSLTEIPAKWDVLNAEIAKKGVLAEESFGVCVSMEGGEIHYIAGIKSELAADFPGYGRSSRLCREVHCCKGGGWDSRDSTSI